jgi:tetratricopeptide (TPR) repeat protein
MVQMILGDHTAARSSLDAALHLVQADGNERGQASTLHQLGRLELMRGNPVGAIEFYDRCLDIAQRAHDYEGLCWTHCRIAEPLRALDQHDKALTHLLECQLRAQQIGDKSAYASSMVEIGSIYRDRENYAAAAAHCEQALRIVEDMPIPDLAIMTSAYIALAEIHNEQHNTEISSRHILHAIELARDAHYTTVEAHAQEVYGDIQLAAGEPARAVQTWRRAAEHYEGIGNVHRVAAIHTKINEAPADSTTVTTTATARDGTPPLPAATHGTSESRDQTQGELGRGHR